MIEEVIENDKMKRCAACKKVYSKRCFYKNKQHSDGLDSYCNYCESERKKKARELNPELVEKHRANGRRWYKENKTHKDAQNKRWQLENESIYRNGLLKSRFGITLEDYNEILENQGSCCLICKASFELFDYYLHVDHCHETGKIRGLLCRTCNVGLGHFRDSIELLQSAIDYLKKYK